MNFQDGYHAIRVVARTNVSESGWHHADIVAAVRKKGSNLRALSVDSGFAPSTLQASLYKVHPAAHQVIAAFLGVSRFAIWPQWYDENDLRRHPKAARREALRRSWLAQNTRSAA